MMHRARAMVDAPRSKVASRRRRRTVCARTTRAAPRAARWQTGPAHARRLRPRGRRATSPSAVGAGCRRGAARGSAVAPPCAKLRTGDPSIGLPCVSPMCPDPTAVTYRVPDVFAPAARSLAVLHVSPTKLPYMSGRWLEPEPRRVLPLLEQQWFVLLQERQRVDSLQRRAGLQPPYLFERKRKGKGEVIPPKHTNTSYA